MSAKYSFSLPARIEFRSGAARDLAELLQGISAGRRVFLVTDPGLLKAGLAEPIADALRKSGYVIQIFDLVKPNPRDVDCEAGGDQIRDFGADVVLALGGGSAMDAAKAIAVLHTHDGRLAQYEGRGKLQKNATPIVAVPTTAGTGSEVTRSSVITDTKRNFKMSINDSRIVPKLAVIDPELTYTLPPALTASTGMDAFVHAIEAFTCKVATPFSDVWAMEAMRVIYCNLRQAVHEGSQEVRSKMMLGSVMAGIAFSNADVASVHCLAEALGGLYDTPHGVANSIFLPHVLEFNIPANPVRHAEAAAACGLNTDGLSEQAAADQLVSGLRVLSRDIGIPTLREIPAVNPGDFERLAEASFINGSTPDNCRDIDKKDYLDLLEKAWGSE